MDTDKSFFKDGGQSKSMAYKKIKISIIKILTFATITLCKKYLHFLKY